MTNENTTKVEPQEFKSVRELLAVPERWTKGGYARAKNGCVVNELSPSATCWCLLGAIYQVYPGIVESENVMDKLRTELGVFRLSDWNDAPERTHEDVKKLVDKLEV